MKFEALIARLKGVPGKSIGIEMIPEAKAWNGSANVAIWFGSSTLINKRQANQKVYLHARPVKTKNYNSYTMISPEQK